MLLTLGLAVTAQKAILESPWTQYTGTTKHWSTSGRIPRQKWKASLSCCVKPYCVHKQNTVCSSRPTISRKTYWSKRRATDVIKGIESLQKEG